MKLAANKTETKTVEKCIWETQLNETQKICYGIFKSVAQTKRKDLQFLLFWNKLQLVDNGIPEIWFYAWVNYMYCLEKNVQRIFPLSFKQIPKLSIGFLTCVFLGSFQNLDY